MCPKYYKEALFVVTKNYPIKSSEDGLGILNFACRLGIFISQANTLGHWSDVYFVSTEVVYANCHFKVIISN